MASESPHARGLLLAYVVPYVNFKMMPPFWRDELGNIILSGVQNKAGKELARFLHPNITLSARGQMTVHTTLSVPPFFFPSPTV